MTVIHIVSFSTKSPSTLPALTSALRALQSSCKRPDGTPYITSLKGGRQRSNEGKDRGMQVTFVMEMETDEDLQYYLWKDPAHEAFKKSVGAEFGVSEVVALDFTEGEYDFGQ